MNQRVNTIACALLLSALVVPALPGRRPALARVKRHQIVAHARSNAFAGLGHEGSVFFSARSSPSTNAFAGLGHEGSAFRRVGYEHERLRGLSRPRGQRLPQGRVRHERLRGPRRRGQRARGQVRSRQDAAVGAVIRVATPPSHHVNERERSGHRSRSARMSCNCSASLGAQRRVTPRRRSRLL